MDKTFYLTTPLYYVNAKPHIGHAYTNILCDSFARYHRSIGEKVFFLTGTDEHGTKIQKAADEERKLPKAYVDEIVPHFKDLWRILGITYDHFIRTTDEGHKKIVQNVLKDLEKKGDIYKASYKGWYCLPCESFWTGFQLSDGKCPDCGRGVEELEEENYFFKLSKYQDWLIKYIEDNPDFILPVIRKNEILGFLREPLEDLCITRPKSRLAWGIDYPGSDDHIVYVWFDALLNYITAPEYTLNEKKFSELWPANVQFLGKDILRQHAVYWPIMLKAIGLEMPRTILAHGWWKIGGAKVSKSLGNSIDPFEIVKVYGDDAFRYFLLKEVTLGLDGAYSEELLSERYRSDLSNDLGNLWHRFASMLQKYFDGEVPKCSHDISNDPLIRETFKLWEHVNKSMLEYNPRQALSSIWAVITLANQFVEEKKPWVIAKDPKRRDELAGVLLMLGECISHIGVLLTSFLPNTAKTILSRLKITDAENIHDEVSFKKYFLTEGALVEKGDPLFPRLDEKNA